MSNNLWIDNIQVNMVLRITVSVSERTAITHTFFRKFNVMSVYDYNYGTESAQILLQERLQRELLKGGASGALKNLSSDPKNIINDCNKWEHVCPSSFILRRKWELCKTFLLAFSHIRNNRWKTFPAGGWKFPIYSLSDICLEWSNRSEVHGSFHHRESWTAERFLWRQRLKVWNQFHHH